MEPHRRSVGMPNIGEENITLQELLRIDERYIPLLLLLDQFIPGEEGDQFDRKLRRFEDAVSSLCPDEARLRQAYSTVRAAAMQNPMFDRRLAAIGTSFTQQQREQLVRGALFTVVTQGKFSRNAKRPHYHRNIGV